MPSISYQLLIPLEGYKLKRVQGDSVVQQQLNVNWLNRQTGFLQLDCNTGPHCAPDYGQKLTRFESVVKDCNLR